MTSGQPADYAAIKAQSLKDTEAGRVPSDEESFKFPEFKLGMELHELVHLYWKYADDLRERIKEVPFGMNSQDEGGGWWFSWATQANDASSCLYRIFPDGAVFCREFPNDKISLNTFDAKLNVAVVVISDLAQLTPQAWDAQSATDLVVRDVFERIQAKQAKVKKEQSDEAFSNRLRSKD